MEDGGDAIARARWCKRAKDGGGHLLVVSLQTLPICCFILHGCNKWGQLYPGWFEYFHSWGALDKHSQMKIDYKLTSWVGLNNDIIVFAFYYGSSHELSFFGRCVIEEDGEGDAIAWPPNTKRASWRWMTCYIYIFKFLNLIKISFKCTCKIGKDGTSPKLFDYLHIRKILEKYFRLKFGISLRRP